MAATRTRTWRDQLPALAKKHAAGRSIADLARDLADRGEYISPTALSRAIADYNRSIDNLHTAGPNDAVTTRAAKLLTEQPWLGAFELADAVNVPAADAHTLRAAAMLAGHGYTLVSLRPTGAVKVTPEQYRAAIEACATALGITGEPVSVSQYTAWREAQPTPAQYPAAMSYLRRGGGSWARAMHDLDLPANEAPRAYDGLDDTDMVTWLAHWLRSLETETPMVIATMPRYEAWTRRERPDAPSLELIRRRGAWTTLVRRAAELERGKRRLPAPRPPVGKR